MSKLTQVWIIGGLIRFLLPTILPQIPYILSSVIEVSTPVNSFKSLQEAFYYLQHNINLYDGGINHHPPLLVVILNLINEYLPRGIRSIAFNLVYALMDLMITARLIQLNKWYYAHNSERTKRTIRGFNDDLIASFYLFNPLVILTNLSHSTLCFVLLFITETLHQVVIKRNFARAMIALSIAGYLSFNSIFLVVPILALAHAVSSDRDWGAIYFQGSAIFIISTGLLIVSSFIMTSSWNFLDSCYGIILRFDKIAPNMGLWWYLFTEMFDFFTPFYLGVFNLYSIVFVFPITLRLFEYKTNSAIAIGDSFLAVILSYIWLSFTKSYPTIGDLAFALSILPIFKSTILRHCKFILATGLTLLVCLLLAPIFYYCWIVLGNGNSNFFYSINLIWGGAHALIIIDLLWARLTYDYIEENDISNEKIPTLRLTQI